MIGVSALCVFILFLSLNAATLAYKDRSLKYKSILPFKKIAEIKKIIGSQPVIVAVDDNIANEWAVYFLRNIPISLIQYRAYMAQSHVIPFMYRALEVETEKVGYALTDSKESFPQSKLLWKGGPYYLWEMEDSQWLQLPTEIRNPNGLEKMGGKSFFWIGNGNTEIDVLSSGNGTVTIFAEFLLGPSLPDIQDRRLVLLTDQRISG